MVDTPFGIPVYMMPMMLPFMPIILPAWGLYKVVFGGDKPMSNRRLASLISSMCCIMIITYAASKFPARTPPIMLATLALTCVSSCSSSIIAVDLKKRAEALIASEEEKEKKK